jgi:anaerobic selenocysteine-containing dehydrogenase
MEGCRQDMGYLQGKMAYRKHEKKGFNTPTKKVELYSTIMEKWGYDPLPKYRETPESPVSQPQMLKKYPYILNAGARSPFFFASEHRMLPWQREIQPAPLMDIHPETAAKHGIKDSDWVYIETPRGRVRQRARLSIGINPGVVTAKHGWDRSNINIVTDNDPAGIDEAMGTTNLRVLMCNISKAHPAEEDD